MKVNIIGGGLAGCALAYILKQAGAVPVIYDSAKEIASGASGNDVGLYNPRLTADLDDQGRFYSTAFFEALEVFEKFGEAIDWNPCGTLFLMNDEKKTVRYPKTVKSWGWAAEDMRLVDTSEASNITGIDITHNALYIPKSGYISPKKLCHAYVRDVEVHLNSKIEDMSALVGDATILACGMGVLKFDLAADLPLRGVRGQVTCVKQTESSGFLGAAISYGGYITPEQGGIHYIGATFQRWLDHSDIIDEDDGDNLDKLFNAIPSLKDDYKLAGHRAAVRTTSKDHFPVVGPLNKSVYVSAAHGSHGILSTLLSAKILTNSLLSQRNVVYESMLKSTNPKRF